MAIINLRNLYPEENLNCFIEVPDGDEDAFVSGLTKEAASVYFEEQRKENAYQRRVYWNKAHYSLDYGDGIHNEAVNIITDPLFEKYTEKLTQKQLIAAINSLPKKQSERIYAHYFLGMSKVDIARNEGVDEKAVRVAIERGIIKLKKYLKNF